MATRFTTQRRIEPALIERRATARLPASAVQVSLGGDDGAFAATLQDISPFGCRLLCLGEVAAGTRATVRFADGEEAPASVVWREAGLVGCRFDAPIARSLVRRLTLALQ